MALFSNLFRGVKELQACEVNDSAHLTIGSRGMHVRLVQTALCRLGFKNIHGREYIDGHYGTTTAAEVMRYKTSRQIINHAYQKTPDNIVGKMTISRLDGEMIILEHVPGLNF
jgi:peptidoglycan hydrolase-like protein with peptidoglycan-binding domain